MASLIYVPILHTEADVKLLQGIQERGKTIASIKEMWVGIQKKVFDRRLGWAQVRIYQESLPVCGREEQIVEELAMKGSVNHRVVVSLLKKGPFRRDGGSKSPFEGV